MSYGQQPPRRSGYGSTRRMGVPVPDERPVPPRRPDQYGDQRQYGGERLYGDRGQYAGERQYGEQYAGEHQYGDERPPGHGQPPGPGYGTPPPRPRRRKRRVGRTLLIIFVAIVLLIGATWLYLDQSLNRVQALGDYPGRPAAGAGTNWLIVGSDSREGLSTEDQERLATGDAAGQRTDTMMLLHIPDNDSKPTLVSLLRDSYVDIPGKGMNRLNAAYAFGGPKLLAQTVEMNTKLRLDHYVEIGFGGFESIVDAVGGVDMCLKEPIDDPKAGIKLPAGCQELGGKEALGYVRTRATPRADLDRVIRQRELVGALTDKATSAGTLLNPFKLVPLLADAPDAVTVDEGDNLHNLPSLAFAIGGASDGSTITTTVPLGPSKRTSGGAAVVTWDERKAPRLWEALRTDQPVPDDVIVLAPS